MGDAFRRQQAKNHKKGRDKAIAEARIPKMFSRPDIFRTVFTIKPFGSEECKAGERLMALLDDPAGPVNLVRGYQKIGFIDGDGAEAFRKAIADPAGPCVAELTITEVSQISGVAKAEIAVSVGE